MAIEDRDSGEVYSWDRGQKGDGDSRYGKAGTVAIGDPAWPKGDGDSSYGKPGTVAIGDRDSGEVFSWDRGQKGTGTAGMVKLLR